MSANLPNKYNRIAEQLRKRIESGELSGTLPGVKQLALDYDVNFMTVNKAINQLEAENLVYRISRKGTYVRKQRNVALAFCDPNPHLLEASFYGPLVSAVQSSLNRCNCFMIFENLYGRSSRSMTSLAQRVDGMILTSGVGTPFLEAMEGKPCIRVMGVTDPGCRFDHISYDSAKVGRIAAEYLTGRGHRRIGFLGYAHSDLFRERFESFRQALRERDIVLWEPPPAPRFSNELLTKQLEAWLAEKDRPTGVFCSTDYEAGFCCNFLYEHGLKPQRDLDVIGCNNDIFGSMMMPQALPASIELCSAEIGRQAAVLLLDRINGLEAPRVVRKFAPRLVPPEEYGRRILRGRINTPGKQGEWNA